MRICESILYVTIALLGVYVIVTDLKNGIVKNKALAAAAVIGLLANAVYYGLFERDFLGIYLFNLFVVCGISILLYAKHYWAAGDSKLLICMTMLIPGRLYDQQENLIPGFVYLIMVFLIAYIYIIFDSLVLWFRKDKTYRVNHLKNADIPEIIKSYVQIYLLLRVLSFLWFRLLPGFYVKHPMIFACFDILLIMILCDQKWFRNKVVSAVMIVILGFAIVLIHKQNPVQIGALIKSYLCIILTYLLRYFVSGYNYCEIPTEDVKQGMVLSCSTVLLFQSSGIHGLPSSMTEDMGDRITSVEADAVRRWGNSKKGRQSIIIVRKMPFAAFIVIGCLIYIVLRMVL